MRFFLVFNFFFFLGIHSILGQLSVPKFFTDNMVLQRDKAVHLWGKGNPDTFLKVQFGEETVTARVGQDSNWSILLKKRRANPNPQSILITHRQQKIMLANILIGDVWLCIGQSNMEWPMEKEMHFEKEVKKANRPLLRFYNPSYAGKSIYNEIFTDSVLRLLGKKDFYMGKWQVSDSNSVRKMSAVGYYFAKELLEKKHVPIGLINMAIGEAPIETFVAVKAMENHPKFTRKAKGNWLTNEELPVWIRERGHQNVGKIPVIHHDELGPNHAFKPGFAFAAGIEPMAQMPIKGILWYQGESNAQEPERVYEYAELQKSMIEDYRKQWKQHEMPFYWAQLSSIDSSRYKSRYWPQFRNKQRKLLEEIDYGGMAVTSDIGAKNDVHPTNKKDVGNRLARWALNNVYSHGIMPSGPLPYSAVYKDGKVVVSYEYSDGLTSSDGKPLRGFSLDGKNSVKADIQKDKIVIPTVRKPKFLYYAWRPWSDANLVNVEKLPASTFKLKVE
ncbi:sialate O-acetylesterase [uncultured Maribacter sp.]|uniref:sialate O-acetylesterase n=1 Tax=uncultured Maribacter sp. TaxID=431308 RepID=UPI0030DADC53|tara:strand:+ start:7142 stop:8647 length:1506 start_codon:yes stop_codon:yes gene_type:complete